MRHAISTEKKGFGIFSAFLGHCLFVIAAYVLYQVSAFLMQQIDINYDVESVGLATFVITMTLAGTSALLRYDARHNRKTVQVLEQRVSQ